MDKYLLLRLTSLMAMAGGLACKELPRNPTTPNEGAGFEFLSLVPDVDSVGVGLRLPVHLSARMTADAAGSQCNFTASGGSFNSTSALLTASGSVDVNGRATVVWFPPASAGRVDFGATVGQVTGDTSVVVTPVPDIVFTGLPDVLAAGETIQAGVQVAAAWAGSAVEIRTPQGLLKAVGPVQGDFDTGTKILPILDATGQAGLLVIAPMTTGQLVVTASLFGTVRSKSIVVR